MKTRIASFAPSPVLPRLKKAPSRATSSPEGERAWSFYISYVLNWPFERVSGGRCLIRTTKSSAN